MLLEALELIKQKTVIKEEEIDRSNNPSLQILRVVSEMKKMQQDMKKHLEWERKEEPKMMKKGEESDHENELLYYEQQIDILGGLIKQLETVVKEVQELEKQAGMTNESVENSAQKDKTEKTKNGYYELEVYQVHIPANIYDGKYYNRQTYPILVKAENEKQAIDFVNKNKEKLLALFDKKRAGPEGKKRYFGRPIEKNVFFKDDYFVKKITTLRSTDERKNKQIFDATE